MPSPKYRLNEKIGPYTVVAVIDHGETREAQYRLDGFDGVLDEAAVTDLASVPPTVLEEIKEEGHEPSAPHTGQEPGA